MKTFKITVGILIVAAILAACSKDKGKDEIQTLTCKGQTVDDYLLWVGTANGGKPMDTKNIAISDLFSKDYLEDMKGKIDYYKSIQIKFVTDTEMILDIPSGIYTIPYYFRNDSLYLVEPGDDDYVFGVGNRNKITIRDGFFHVVYANIWTTTYEHQRRFTLEEVLSLDPLESLDQMTHETDSLAIYNVSYVFEKE